MEESFEDKIASKCLHLYSNLPKTGKPTNEEWTVLSCFVKYQSDTKDIEVVSLGTGTKCIGKSKMSSTGDILNDSHAEVVARRGFLIYLYENISNAIQKENSIFVLLDTNKCKLKENITFVMYSSQLPCGDASIIPKTDVESVGKLISMKRKNKNSLNESSNHKNIKLDDIHRTGAKCLSESVQDSKNPGLDYHSVGQVRYKPGRGDPTLSVSCSDKMAKWCHLGVQGALLSLLMDNAIHIKHFVFGNEIPYSESTLIRALLLRNRVHKGIDLKFSQSKHIFIDTPGVNKQRPCASSIVWVHLKEPLLEVSVQGKRLGVTKKDLKTEKGQLEICKLKLFRRFIKILQSNENICNSIVPIEKLSLVNYITMKRMSRDYYGRWNKILPNIFGCWTVKSEKILEFNALA